MALSNYTKGKLIDLINGDTLGTAPSLFLGFAKLGAEVFPYTNRQAITASYSGVTNELTFGAVTFPAADSTVADIDALHIYDAVSAGNLLLVIDKDALGVALQFTITAGQNRNYQAGDLTYDLRKDQDNDIQAVVIGRLADWLIGTAVTPFSGAEMALFDGATEVTSSFANGRRPVALSNTAFNNTTELNFGTVTGIVSFDSGRIYDSGGTLLVSNGVLTPAVVNLNDGDSGIINTGQLTFSIT